MTKVEQPLKLSPANSGFKFDLAYFDMQNFNKIATNENRQAVEISSSKTQHCKDENAHKIGRFFSSHIISFLYNLLIFFFD